MLLLGHECVGTIFEAGDKFENFKIGDRVIINPMPKCGNCHWCDKGQFSLCPEASAREIGLNLDHDGGFAEYVRILD